MKNGSRSVTDSRERLGLRRGLVIVQVGLSLVLMVGALLFIRSLTNLRSTDLGFNPDGLLVVGLDLRRAPVPKHERLEQYREIRERVQRLPTVAAAAETAIVPVSGSMWNNNILIDGKVQGTFPNFNRVSPGYFSTMQTPIVAGRDFADSDSTGAPDVAIVNGSFARRFFGSPNAVEFTFGIGHFVPRQDVDAVKQILAQTTSLHTYVRCIVWTYDPTLFDPGTPASMPDGRWGQWSMDDPNLPPGSGSRIRSSRSLDCRYWEFP
jgi:hypothetical protein